MSMKKEKELLVAVASQKGGVGKSVFTVLLASVLHYHKKRDACGRVVDLSLPRSTVSRRRAKKDIEKRHEKRMT